jgi:Phr family secreted Rap phosphatase inhibitor
MKKIYLTILGISLISILSLGLNDSFKNQAVNIGDGGGAPARPDYFYIKHTLTYKKNTFILEGVFYNLIFK